MREKINSMNIQLNTDSDEEDEKTGTDAQEDIESKNEL